jgi:phage major head subunit gpT-like protein
MLINGSAIRAVFTGLSSQFNNALVAVPTDYQATTMMVPSNSTGVDYAWLNRFPKMRQWVGDKHIKALALGNYYVKNLDWETTIAVDRNDLEDDQLGIYNAQAQMAGQSAGELYGDIVTSLKNAAFTGLGMDGVAYYSDSHTLTNAGGTTITQDNKLTAALSAASLAALVSSYGAARQAIMKFTDEEGQPLGLMPDLLEVPPALEAVALIIANADKLVDEAPNPYRGTCRVQVNPRLTSDTAWMLHVSNRGAIKPFVLQTRKAPTFVSQTSMENDDVFNRREFKFGAEARAAGAYGFWQLSVGSTGLG